MKAKRLAGFPKPYRDTLAHWSAFRNLGFDAAEIYFGFGEVSGMPDVLHLQLQTQGKKFVVMCAVLPGARYKVVAKTWERIAAALRSSTLTERNACYRSHLIGSSPDYFAAFVQSIRAKGILVPELLKLGAEPAAGQS